MKKWILLLLLSFLGNFPWNAIAKPDPLIKNHVVRVGVLPNQGPIAYQSLADGTWHGIAISLWEQIAELNHWQYEFVPVSENTEHVINELMHHQYDVVIGGTTVTYARIQKVDFSRTFLINKMLIFEKGIATDHFLSTLWFVFSKVFNYIFLGAAILFVLTAHFLWIYERETNAPDLNKGYIKSIAYAMWYLLMLLAGGFLVDKPNAAVTRALVLLVLIASIVFSALVSAAFTSSLTLSLSQSQNEKSYSTQDIRGKRYASVEGYYSTEMVKKLGGEVVLFSNLPEALNAMLKNRDIDGVAGNAIILDNYLKKNPALSKKFPLYPIVLANDEFAFAFPKHSPYRNPTDYALIKLQDNGQVAQICAQYVDKENATACIV